MRIIGLDIHRAFAEAVAWEDGRLRRLGRVDMRRDLLEAFAAKLSPNDVVVIEATGNASSAASVVASHVKKVVIANPKQVRIIAHAKIKTDTIDAGVLAQLYASGFLPEVWIPDEPTQALRRQVTRRNQVVRQRSRLKNVIQSILHGHLIPSCPHADLCGAKGRSWLNEQIVPEDERLAIDRHLREFDRLGEDLQVIERDLARSALEDEGVKRLMTIPGVDMTVALAMKAAIGEVTPLRRAAEAGELSRPEPQRQAVRTRPCLPWADHQARPRSCARHARRSGLGGGTRTRATPCLLPACASPSWPACRGRRNRAQARCRNLAFVDEGRELRLGPAIPACQEATRHGTEGWEQGCARPKGSRARLQHQEPQGRRAPLGGTGGEAYTRFVSGWNPRGPKKARTDAANEVRR